MAWDEAIARNLTLPMLRWYSWDRPSASFGYSQSWDIVREEIGTLCPVRRWTGGGIVNHSSDSTFTLFAPQCSPLYQLPPRKRYTWIHDQLRIVCRQEQPPSNQWALASPFPSNLREPKLARNCFQQTGIVEGDLLCGEQKWAGGAQRKGSFGLVHQGSISQADLPSEFPTRLAQQMGSDVTVLSHPPQVPQATVEQLAQTRYASGEWLSRVS
ncbi:MAG: hypothetical protein AAF191_20330 [Verrucomicrobiota bacterium]